MGSPAGYVLCLSNERIDAFSERRDERRFAEPVEEFAHSRHLPLVCFISAISGQITHISQGRRGMMAGDDLRRLNLVDIYTLHESVPIETIIGRAPKRVQKRLRKALEEGGLLTPTSFQALLERMIKERPDTADYLKKYSELSRQRIARLPTPVKANLAEQKEAVATALSISDIDRHALQFWRLPEEGAPKSFLDGLSQVRMREDAMIVNDLSVLPGYDQFKTSKHTSVVFENEKSKLTVVLANRLPLEQLTGTDLIYYNETFSCFLMVQYKAMEMDDDEEISEAVFRFPEEQLTEEMQRMESLLVELNKCSSNDVADGFRLSENPFFIKFCPRIVFEPDNVGLVKGMYLPLNYWKLLSKHPSMNGPKGGKRLSYKNVRRYFDNTEFTTLAGGGWVGTNIDQSEVLGDAIRSTLESGRAVVLAVNEVRDRRHIKDDDQD